MNASGVASGRVHGDRARGRLGRLRRRRRRRRALEVEAPATAPRVEVGGSVSVNGVCLTAESVDGDTLVFHAVPETLSRSTLGGLATRRAASTSSRRCAPATPLGGHIVQGHVDGVGRVRSVEAEGEGLRVVVEAPAELLRYCVEKGSITVEGVSLTIAELRRGRASASR